MAMASSYVLVVIFVIGGLVSASHASQAVSPTFMMGSEGVSSTFISSDVVSPTFTIMNYLKVEDFMSYHCDCVDVGGTVSPIIGTVASCVDKEIQASSCPTGLAPTIIYCKFRLFTRNRGVATVTVAPTFTNIQVWKSTGPPKTYFQLTDAGVYATTADEYFDVSATNLNSIWYIPYYPAAANNAGTLLRDKSVGNGWSFLKTSFQ